VRGHGPRIHDAPPRVKQHWFVWCISLWIAALSPAMTS
jgi:hypothetical protein